MSRLLKLLLAAGVVWAIWVLLRALLDEPRESADQAGEAHQPSSPKPAAERGNGASSPSKAELYGQAQELGIEGRSKMTKDELAAAIASARQAAPA